MDKKDIKAILASYHKRRMVRPDLTPAAVLMPIHCDTADCRIVFAQRSQNVLYHKGQNAFPGGRHELADRDLLATALRESQEEIGLNPADVEVLGELDDQVTTSGFVISPFVGAIPHPYRFVAHRGEVDDIFDVPLSVFLADRNWREEQPEDGDAAPTYYVDYRGRTIWGATARILKQFVRLLSARSRASR